MITETYVSFEVAKLLKENGFPQNTFRCHYIIDGNINYKSFENRCGFGDYDIIAPTLQMALKWLRVTYKHHIVAEPRLYNSANTDSDFSRWLWTIITEDSYLYSEGEDFPTYESAAEAALKHCLENLI